MPDDAVIATVALSTPWQTLDPFLFCVHHEDGYPAGDGQLGLAATHRAGRSTGSDFSGRDGFSLYHGERIPGFPRHPHRGFETVTLARRGFIDHADSLGAAARFGEGDVQWMTAGAGIVHSEMFPMLHHDRDNPVELFQIWLNLPRAAKFAAPHFSMLWAGDVPVVQPPGSDGVEVVLVAGELAGQRPPAPPPASWAHAPENHVAIWTLNLAPGARWHLPAAVEGLNRVLYLFAGETLRLGDQELQTGQGAQLASGASVALLNGTRPAQALLLQGRPIDEPVAQHGPFVMNEPAELRQAFEDYQHDAFGGWSWPDDGPVHGHGSGRFARRPDGRTERPARVSQQDLRHAR